MRRILLSTIPAAALLLSSCSKNFLNRQPLDAYSNSSLWTDSSDAAAALNGVYAGQNTSWSDNASGWADGFLVNYMDCASDNAYSQFVWEGFQDYGDGLVTAADQNNDIFWGPLYTNIQKCNWFLENVGATPMGAVGKAQMIAQVRFIRAYQYFWLTQCYGDAVLDTTTVTTSQANTSVRTPKASVVAFELSELSAAIPNLPTSYPSAQQGQITQGAAIALKMRIELYEGDYADCITDAQTIMNVGIYSLSPSYVNLFRIGYEASPEDILDVQYLENTHPNGTLGVMVPNSLGGWSSINPTQSLVDNYETITGKLITDPNSGYDSTQPYTNRDPRLTATILVPGQFGNGIYYDPITPTSDDYYPNNNCSKTGYEVRKFTSNLSDFDNIWSTSLDMMLIRYSEVLLSYAEAKIEAGQIDASVYAAIDQVRVRAGLPATDQSVYNSQSTLRTLIRRERRSELAMEGLRWWDIQRWQIGPQVMNGIVYGVKTGTVNTSTGQVTFTGPNIQVQTRLFDASKNYLWPIPQSEINVNNKITQNPGY
jgi:hypothetical protein